MPRADSCTAANYVHGIALFNHLVSNGKQGRWNSPHPLALLSTRGKRPCHRPTTNKRNELPPLHSITSSARERSVGAIVRLSTLAALRLMASSNLTGRSIGKSAGLAPFRTLST